MKFLFSTMLLVGMVVSLPDLAAGKDNPTVQPRDASETVFVGGSTRAAEKAQTAPVFVLGGPVDQRGSFEDAGGQPNWQGWSSRDLTVGTETHWNISDFNCENLDSSPTTNHAWWCGEILPDPCGADAFGYGHDWAEMLYWSAEPDVHFDPEFPVHVEISADINFDLEDAYDYLTLVCKAEAGWIELASFTGFGEDVAAFGVHDAWPIGQTPPYRPVELAWLVRTDGSYDDEDCLYESSGAVQIDNIQIIVSQYGPTPTFSHLEDCEGATLWQPAVFPGIGDYAQLMTEPAEIDPCEGNPTPQVIFIDDGIVVPGTGGSPGQTWTYGPGGYVVNTSGGLFGEGNYIHNRIESPAIAWDAAWNCGGLSMEVYRHLPITEAGILYEWAVRSTASLDPADLAEAEWRNDSYGYYGIKPEWLSRQYQLAPYLEPGTRWLQVALGLFDYRSGLPWAFGDDASPGPYFDNVSVTGWFSDEPFMTAEARNLARDGFPASGLYNEAYADVRFDSALNLGEPYYAAGDSLVITAIASVPGGTLTGPPKMHYRLVRNSIFDTYRSSGLPDMGFVVGDSLFTEATSLHAQGRFAFDLPDEGFLFPGDVLHYRFEAIQDPGNMTILPADTTGFDDFSPVSPYPTTYTMRALPSVSDLSTMEQPPLLLWVDDGDPEAADSWRLVMNNLGFVLGEDYDLFATRTASSGYANGLGRSASTEQIHGYQTIVYATGNESRYLLIDKHGSQEDLNRLDEWMYWEPRVLLLIGNQLASVLDQENPGLLLDLAGISWTGHDYEEATGIVSPEVVADEHILMFPEGFRRSLAGGCPHLPAFDAVTADAAYKVARYVLPGTTSEPNQSLAAATVRIHPDGLAVGFLAFDALDTESPQETAVGSLLTYLQDTPGIPAANASSAVTAATDSVSLSVYQRGSGTRLDAAMTADGNTMDATISVTVRDAGGVPVAGVPAEVLWLGSTGGGLVNCPTPTPADAVTDSDGRTSFAQSIAAGGTCRADQDDTLAVFIDGESAPTGNLHLIRVNSPDLDGDGQVDADDRVLFRLDLYGPYRYRSDFFWDGMVRLSDAVIMREGKGSTCE